jgi:hypothetical protein
LYPYRQHKGRKLVLGDRTEALVYILAHELRHMWQQHGTMKISSFPVGRQEPHRIFYITRVLARGIGCTVVAHVVSRVFIAAAADGYVPTAENVSRNEFTKKAIDAFKLMVSRIGAELPENAFATAQGKS